MSSQEPEFNPENMPDGQDYDELLVPFDVHEGSSRQGMIKLIIGAAILLALAFLVLKLYQPGVRDRGDPPLITADNTPFKIVPEDQEGAQTPDQDKEIFEVMSGRDTESDVVTLPSPEVPISLPENLSGSADDQDSDLSSSGVTSTQPERVEPAPQTQQPTQSVPTQAETPSVTGASEWVVQVASLRSRSEADRTFADISGRYATLLRQYQSDIRRVDLAEKGIYYRVRIAGFDNKAEASSLCNQLKSAGQACYVTR